MTDRPGDDAPREGGWSQPTGDQPGAPDFPPEPPPSPTPFGQQPVAGQPYGGAPHPQGHAPQSYGQPPFGQQPFGQQQPYGQHQQPPQAYGQPMYGQPLYGQPYGQPGYAQGAPKNGLGTAGLVLGILAVLFGLLKYTFFIGLVLGILALIFGLIGRSRATKGEATNKTPATIGAALGAAGIVLSLVIGVSWLQDLNFGDYVSCVEDAGDDQVAVDRCTDEFVSNAT